MSPEDDQAFERLYYLWHPRVLAYVLRRVRVDQAADIVEEVFLIAWRRRAAVPAEALPWLLVTARNLVSEELRRHRRRDALAQALALSERNDTTPGADVIAIERLTVLEALSELSEKDREALIMTVWDGLTAAEAARVVGCSSTAFAVRLHRARRRLAAALDGSSRQGRVIGPERSAAGTPSSPSEVLE
ncbi:MAG: sigma-70 family RNA polymerase sigma factor [Pseudonocardia sp.]|nr:sigma-70 family RNA polymerase sigma factor [Pseudonocardia sp.]